MSRTIERVMADRGKWLYKVLSDVLKIQSWDGAMFEPLEDVQGTMANIYRIQPIWKGENLPQSLVIKIPNYQAAASLSDACPDFPDIEERRTASIKSYHSVETFFYNLFRRSTPPPVAIPQIYYTSDQEEPDEFPVIVMEDLSEYRVVDLVEGLNESQLYATVDELAKLHYYSFTNTEWKEKIPSIKDRRKLGSFPKIVDYFAKKLRKQNLECFGQVEKVLELLGDGDWNDRYLDACSNNELVSAIAHGDLWVANFIWDGDKVKAIIDWQMAHCGAITEDIMRVLVTGTTTKRRKTLTKKVLGYYFDAIKRLFETSDQEVPFSRDQLYEIYRKMLPHTAASAIFAVGVWCNSPVLKNGSPQEERRVKELQERLKDFLDETLEQYKSVENST